MSKNTMVRNSHPLRVECEKAGLPLNSIHSYVLPQLNRKALEAAREQPPRPFKGGENRIAILTGPRGTLCENVRVNSAGDTIAVGDGALPVALFPTMKLVTPREFAGLALKANRPTKVFHRSKKTSLIGLLYGDPSRPYTTLARRESNGSFTFKEVKTTADGHNQKELVAIEGISDTEKRNAIAEFKGERVAKKTLRIGKSRR